MTTIGTGCRCHRRTGRPSSISASARPNRSTPRANHPTRWHDFLTYFYSADAQAKILVDLRPGAGAGHISAGQNLPVSIRATAADPGGAEHGVADNDYGYTTWTFWPPKTETYLIETDREGLGRRDDGEQYLQGHAGIFDKERAAGDRAADPRAIEPSAGAPRLVAPAGRPTRERCAVHVNTKLPRRSVSSYRSPARPTAGDALFRRKVVPWLFVAPDPADQCRGRGRPGPELRSITR